MLPRINNFKAFATTGVGVGVAQLIALLSVPFIARLSGPEIFGQYSYYNSIVVVLCVFASLKLEFSVFTISWRLYPFVKLLVGWLVPLMSTALVVCLLPVFVEDASVSLMAAVMFLLVGACLFEFYIQDNIKLGRFKVNAVMRICRAIVVPLVFLLLYWWLGISPELILISFSVANLTSVFIGGVWEVRSPFLLFRRYLLVGIYHGCQRVIIYLVPGHFLNRYAAGCLVLLSGFMGYQASDIAKFALVEKLLIAPVGIVTTAVSDVVKREILKDPLVGLVNYYRVSCYSFLIALLGCGVVFFYGETLILIVMGGQWEGVGSFAIAMLPLFAALLLFSPITHCYTVLNKQDVDFFWQCGNAVCLSIAVIVGFQVDYLSAVWAYSLAASVMLFVSALICRSIVVGEGRVGS